MNQSLQGLHPSFKSSLWHCCIAGSANVPLRRNEATLYRNAGIIFVQRALVPEDDP